MLNLFVVIGLFAALSIVVMSGAMGDSGPIIMELASVLFAISAAASAFAIAAVEG